MPLLGPIGGGLAGAAVGGLAGAAVAGGAAAAASSEARTISLFDTARKPFLLFWGEKAMQFLEELGVFDVIIRELEDDDEENINPAAADAMLQVAMLSLSLSL